MTHYPQDIGTAADITRNEAWTERYSIEVTIPAEFDRILEEIAFAARASELVDQSSGVSARLSIAAKELLVSNLERRGLLTGEESVYPRVCDLNMLLPAITGKLEIVYEGEEKGVEVVAQQLIGEAVKKAFQGQFPAVGRELGGGGESDIGPYAEILKWFMAGHDVLISDELSFTDYEARLLAVPTLEELASTHGKTREERALAAELILEGLHLHLKLAREDLESSVTYKEMIKFELLRPGRGRRNRGDFN
jgi:magnesium chelatase subunit I